MKTLVVTRSENRKLGPIPTTMRPQATCPIECPLMGNGCYAENKTWNGSPSLFERTELSTNPTTLETLRARNWRKPPRAIRFNVTGDFFRADGTPDTEYIAETNATATSRDWVAWSYTHGWRKLDPTAFDYVVRASCETPAEVEEAQAAGWHTALVVDDRNPQMVGTKIGGQQVVQCPATNGKAASCDDCRLCGRRTAIIAFPTHGSRRRVAAAVLTRRNTA